MIFNVHWITQHWLAIHWMYIQWPSTPTARRKIQDCHWNITNHVHLRWGRIERWVLNLCKQIEVCFRHVQHNQRHPMYCAWSWTTFWCKYNHNQPNLITYLTIFDKHSLNTIRIYLEYSREIRGGVARIFEWSHSNIRMVTARIFERSHSNIRRTWSLMDIHVHVLYAYIHM